MTDDDLPTISLAPCRPVNDFTGLPPEYLGSPPQVDDTLGVCERCGREIWVGPRKRFLSSLHVVELLCYQCGLEWARDAAEAGVTEVDYIDLNPGREDRPRWNS